MLTIARGGLAIFIEGNSSSIFGWENGSDWCGGRRPLPASSAIGWFVGDGEKALYFLRRNEGSIWHLADKQPASGFVAYWTKSRQKPVFGPKLSAANDPKPTYWAF